MEHFCRFEQDSRTLPVLWHQCLLVFAQRYKHDISSEQKEVTHRTHLFCDECSLTCPARPATEDAAEIQITLSNHPGDTQGAVLRTCEIRGRSRRIFRHGLVLVVVVLYGASTSREVQRYAQSGAAILWSHPPMHTPSISGALAKG